MKIIFGNKESGKTEKILQLANKHGSIVLSSSPHALWEKARALGYTNVEIVGFGDLNNDNFSLGKDLYIDDVENALQYLMDRYYKLNVRGISVTIEE